MEGEMDSRRPYLTVGLELDHKRAIRQLLFESGQKKEIMRLVLLLGPENSPGAVNG
jgi:hypothetical protein